MKWVKVVVDGDDITQTHSYSNDGNFVDVHRVYTFGSFYLRLEDGDVLPTGDIVIETFMEYYYESLDNQVEIEYDIIGNADKELFKEPDNLDFVDQGWSLTEIVTKLTRYTIEETKRPYGEFT